MENSYNQAIIQAIEYTYMNETQAFIERIKRVNHNYQHIEMAVDVSLAGIKAGQSVLARRVEANREIDHWDPYLRELWFPVAVNGNKITVERPNNVLYIPGEIISLVGPIGEPLRFRKSLRNILLLVYHTPPSALLMLIHPMVANGVSVTMVLMGSAKDYDTQHLPEQIEVIRAEDDLTWSDMVMTLGWADQVFVLVGQGDELSYFREVMNLIEARRADIPQNYIFGFFQNVLPCGVGACYACMLKMTEGTKLQCVDGPAFDLTLLRLD